MASIFTPSGFMMREGQSRLGRKRRRKYAEHRRPKTKIGWLSCVKKLL